MKKKFLAAIAALGLAASALVIAPLSAGAAGTTYTSGLTNATDGTNPVSQNTISFDKYLVVKGESAVPGVTFNFTVTPTDGNTAPVLDGVSGAVFKTGDSANTGSNTAGEVVFTAGEAAITDETEPTAECWLDSTSGNEKYAKKTLTLDFSNVLFTEPGIYRYQIAETGGMASVANDVKLTEDNGYRTLDVYVCDYEDLYNGLTDAQKLVYTAPNTSNHELYIKGYALYNGIVTGAPEALTPTKSSAFVNAYPVQKLTFGKSVTGNQGSKDKYFKFTVQLTNPDNLAIPATDTFVVQGNWEKAPEKNLATTYTSAEMKAANNVSSLTFAQLTAGYSFYLRDQDSISILGIPSGLGYVLTEVQEDYTPSVSFADTGDKNTGDKTGEGTAIAGVTAADGKSYSVTDSYLKEGATVTFTNNRAGTIPTGILSTVAGSAGIVALGVLGVAGGMLYVKKKKSEDEEE